MRDVSRWLHYPYVWYGLSALLLLLVQSFIRTLFPGVGIFIPNLVIPLLVFCALFEQRIATIFLLLICGLFIDITSASLIIGPGAACLIVPFIIIVLLSPLFFLESTFVAAVCGLGASILSDIVYQCVNLHPLDSVLTYSVVVAIRGVIMAAVTPSVIHRYRNVQSYAKLQMAYV